MEFVNRFRVSYNVSGRIQLARRLDSLPAIVREVLGTDRADTIGHYDGSTTVSGQSARGRFMSNGFGDQGFLALIAGDPPAWQAFADDLAALLRKHDIPHSITVHDRIMNKDHNGAVV